MFNTNQLSTLENKLAQVLSNSAFINTSKAPKPLSVNQTFNVNGRTITSLTSCFKNDDILIVQDSITKKYYCIAGKSSSIPNRELSRNVVLSRQTRPLNKLEESDKVAILYSFIKDEVKEFWLQTSKSSKKVAEFPKTNIHLPYLQSIRKQPIVLIKNSKYTTTFPIRLFTQGQCGRFSSGSGTTTIGMYVEETIKINDIVNVQQLNGNSYLPYSESGTITQVSPYNGVTKTYKKYVFQSQSVNLSLPGNGTLIYHPADAQELEVSYEGEGEIGFFCNITGSGTMDPLDGGGFTFAGIIQLYEFFLGGFLWRSIFSSGFGLQVNPERDDFAEVIAYFPNPLDQVRDKIEANGESCLRYSPGRSVQIEPISVVYGKQNSLTTYLADSTTNPATDNVPELTGDWRSSIVNQNHRESAISTGNPCLDSLIYKRGIVLKNTGDLYDFSLEDPIVEQISTADGFFGKGTSTIKITDLVNTNLLSRGIVEIGANFYQYTYVDYQGSYITLAEGVFDDVQSGTDIKIYHRLRDIIELRASKKATLKLKKANTAGGGCSITNKKEIPVNMPLPRGDYDFTVEDIIPLV
jgi:hypothetical protein